MKTSGTPQDQFKLGGHWSHHAAGLQHDVVEAGSSGAGTQLLDAYFTRHNLGAVVTSTLEPEQFSSESFDLKSHDRKTTLAWF